MSDVVVVGGGIVGASTCYYAKRMGASCTLIERDGIASHASGFAFGGLYPRVIATPDSEMPQFAAESFEEHRKLHEELGSVHGVHSTWRRRSSISLAWHDSDVQSFKEQATMSYASHRWLDEHELHDLEPRISRAALGGLMVEGSAEVDSSALTTSLCQIASPTFLLTEIVDVNFKNDRVKSVKSLHDEMIEGDTFVFAMGPWSNLAFNCFNLGNPVKPLKGQILRLKIDGRPFQHSFSTYGNYMSSKPDGLLWIGTTEEEAEFNESPTNEGRREIMAVLKRMVPGISNVDVVKQTACLRPISLDGEVILGRIPGFKNAFIGTGGGRKGILYGPSMGKYLAAYALASDKPARWSTLAPTRFSDTT